MQGTADYLRQRLRECGMVGGGGQALIKPDLQASVAEGIKLEKKR